jgi:hypothetical protein
MRSSLVSISLLALIGCASAGTVDEYRWSVDGPKSVERGAEFTFRVRTIRAGGAEVPDVPYRFQITWPAGGGNPLSHEGMSGTAQKVHARMAFGPATLIILGVAKDGKEAPVAQASFEVK